MINSYGDYMIVGVIKAFWSNKGVTQPQVSPTAQNHHMRKFQMKLPLFFGEFLAS